MNPVARFLLVSAPLSLLFLLSPPGFAATTTPATQKSTVENSDDKASPYNESLRPQFHFTSATGWLNDPNGLVFYDGQYHLFFQHNPHGTDWGYMTWGHAESIDLVHWHQVSDAITPDRLGTIFSGSAVVDWHNTSGLGVNGQPPLVAMYTAAGGTSTESKGQRFTQCIAYSNDHGQTWIKFSGNPVIPWMVHENRDPKLVWYAPGKKWVLALYKDGNTYALFSSADLKTWKPLQELNVPNCSECPDFFPMPLDGDRAKIKWVFTSASGQYLVGSFDGTTYSPEQKLQQVDYGHGYYAVQTYSDIPQTDGRRIQIAWMRNGRYPKMPFNQQMSFPAEMTLRTTPDGPQIFRWPVREIDMLHGNEQKWTDVILRPGENLLSKITGSLFDIRLDIEPGDATEVGLVIHGQRIRYRVKDHKLTALGDAQVPLIAGRLRLRLLIDRTSIETFANDGRLSFTGCFLPRADAADLELFSTGGEAKVHSISVCDLKSAW